MATNSLPLETLQEAVNVAAQAGGVNAASKVLNIPRTTLVHRLGIAERAGITPTCEMRSEKNCASVIKSNSKARINWNIQDGHVLIGSDCHYWPGVVSTAHKAFVKFCKDLKPQAVIMNGDVFDGATVSRHARIGWENRPSVKEELETVTERLNEIQDAARGALRAWGLGNHDARFETKLANTIPEFAGVVGFHLKDHFPNWSPCWGVWINDNVVVKHRWKGGIHASYNNTLRSGVSIVTGHLHSALVRPYSDYRGTRYGVDCGTMAQPYGPQFEAYTEDNPVDWREAFCVLTFHKGKLLQPELAMKFDDGAVEFRGRVIEV